MASFAGVAAGAARPSRGLRSRARNLSAPADLVAQLKEQFPESACHEETEDGKAIKCYKAAIAATLQSEVEVEVDADGNALEADADDDGFVGKRFVSKETLIYSAGSIKPTLKINETFWNVYNKAWPMLYNWVTGSEPEEGKDFTWDELKEDLWAFGKAATFGGIKLAKTNLKVMNQVKKDLGA